MRIIRVFEKSIIFIDISYKDLTQIFYLESDSISFLLNVNITRQFLTLQEIYNLLDTVNSTITKKFKNFIFNVNLSNNNKMLLHYANVERLDTEFRLIQSSGRISPVNIYSNLG